MLKLARWTTTHRLYIAIGWVLLLIGVNAISQSSGGPSYSNNFTLPNSDAQRASDLLARSFPAQAGDRDTIVFKVSSDTVNDPSVKAHMSALFAQVSGLPHVAGVVSPYDPRTAGKAISRNEQIAFATVVFDEKANDLPKSAGEGVVAAAEAARIPGLQIELGGQAIEETQQEGFGFTTAIGLLAAIVVLLITFGSLVAMGLPIVTALFGLGTGLGLIALFTHVVDTADFSSELAAMIGLGVGIDYSLFIVTRFREAYATPGPTFGNVRESVVQSMDTAGRAVLFAGCTVVIALLGMMLLGVDFLYGVAIAASIGVLLVMVASLTLLPALLTIAGNRLVRPGRRARRRGAKATDLRHGQTWLRWSRFVQSHSWPIALAATLALLLVAAPATALRLGSSDASNDPTHFTTYKAYQLLAEGFGKGFNGPLQVVAQVPNATTSGHEATKQGAPPSSTAKADVEQLRAAMSGDPRGRGRCAREVQPRRERGDHLCLPHLLSPGVRNNPTRIEAARRNDPAGRRADRHARLRRRHHRRRGRLRQPARQEAPAVHRRRRAALCAAAHGRVPLACDPTTGGFHEPAFHRRLARRDRRRLPMGVV